MPLSSSYSDVQSHFYFHFVLYFGFHTSFHFVLYFGFHTSLLLSESHAQFCSLLSHPRDVS